MAWGCFMLWGRYLRTQLRDRVWATGVGRGPGPLTLAVVVQSLCPILYNPMEYSKPGFPILHRLLEFAQVHVESMMLSDHLILCHPPLLLPSIFPSIRVFCNELALFIRWPKYWSFSISPSSEYSGLISFRIDWLDLLAVQGTFKSLLQNHSSKALILQCSAFFMVQLSHPSIPDY